MNIDNLYHVFARTLFGLALTALSLAFVEQFFNLLNSSLIGFIGLTYTPGRLVELAGAVLLFVITVLLRQIRDALRKSDSA